MAKPSARVRKLLQDLPAFRSMALWYEAGAEDVGAVADRLGRVAAVRAELQVFEDLLRDVIKENGEAAVEGLGYRVTLATYEQERLDTKAIKEAKKPPVVARWLGRFYRTKVVTSVSVKARLGTGLGEPAIAAE
jgi:hypothetical protein